MPDSLHMTLSPSGTARLTLNRPELHNAFDEGLIAELTESLRELAEDPSVRCLVLAAKGRSFSAGADLAWMQRMANASEADNLRDAERLGDLMQALHQFPKPTIALVQGAAYGGGVGLVACCDIAIAATSASFCLSEVKLGLIPAVISPYVIAAIGGRAASRWFLTAERFDADEAHRIGLVHHLVPDDQLEDAAEKIVARLQEGGPAAHCAAKLLIRRVAGQPIDADLIGDTAQRIATIRATDEAREGLQAFLEKRPPAWRVSDVR